MVVPSVSMSAVIEASPSLPAATRVSPPFKTSSRLTIGSAWRSAISTSSPFESRRRTTGGGANFGAGPTWGITDRSNVSWIAAIFGLARGACLSRSTATSAGRGFGVPGNTSSRTRDTVKYWLATRFTSAAVTRKSRRISSL